MISALSSTVHLDRSLRLGREGLRRPYVMILQDSKSEHNSNPLTNLNYISNDISDNLDDHDLAELLYACTAGGIHGRMASVRYMRYIAHSEANSAQALRVLAAMEARQRGGRR